MAKKRPLKRDEIERITGEKTYFEETICLLDGLLVNEYENGNRFTDESTNLTHDDFVTISFNKKVYDRISKYLRNIMGMRGIKDINSIEENDADVRELLRKWKNRSGKRFIKPAVEKQKARQFIEMVAAEHRPRYMTTFLQLFCWAIVYEDVFKVGSGQIEWRLDIEIDESYWLGLDVEEVDVDVELDRLLADYTLPRLEYDRTNPLEIMLAVTTALMEKHPEFAKTLATYFQRVFVTFTVLRGDGKFDDAGFLRTTLDDLLSEDVDVPDSVGKQSDTSGSSGSNGKKVGSKANKQGKHKDEQTNERV